MILKFVWPRQTRLLNPHINTKPSLGSNFVDRELVFKWNKYLLEAECKIKKTLQTGGEIHNLSSSKTPAPVVIEWCPPYTLITICLVMLDPDFTTTQAPSTTTRSTPSTTTTEQGPDGTTTEAPSTTTRSTPSTTTTKQGPTDPAPTNPDGKDCNKITFGLRVVDRGPTLNHHWRLSYYKNQTCMAWLCTPSGR